MTFLESVVSPPYESFFRRNDENDIRLGEIVPQTTYQEAEVVIVGCPQDEGVRRNGGRVGAAFAPEAFRRQFYKLTDYGIYVKIFDLGDIKVEGEDLEKTHQNHTIVVERLLKDGKKVVVIGGGNDISYADGLAMSQTFGASEWLAFNIDAHLDVRFDAIRNSGTPYFQLLNENLLSPVNFHEVGFHKHAASNVYVDYLKNLGANLFDFEQIETLRRKREELIDVLANRFLNTKPTMPIFWGIDLDVVRASDAPGVSAPNSIGLFAEELLGIVEVAAQNPLTKIVEFSEMNPKYDLDERTARLTAVAVHRFCQNIGK